jgi:hypothetical protein
LRAAGNQIGTISNIGMKICTLATEIGYYKPKNNKSYGYGELESLYYEKKKEWLEENIREFKDFYCVRSMIDNITGQLKEFKYMMSEDEIFNYKCELEELKSKYSLLSYNIENEKEDYFKKALEEKINNGELVPVETLGEEKIKQILIKQFYKYKKESYLALQLQMIAIDMPKTLKEVDEKLIKSLKKGIPEKNNPNFRKYTIKYKDRKYEPFSKTHSVLNLYSKMIAKTLLKEWYDKNEEIKEYAKSDRVSTIHSILSNATETEYTEEVTALVKAIFNSWKNNSEKIRS